MAQKHQFYICNMPHKFELMPRSPYVFIPKRSDKQHKYGPYNASHSESDIRHKLHKDKNKIFTMAGAAIINYLLGLSSTKKGRESGLLIPTNETIAIAAHCSTRTVERFFKNNAELNTALDAGDNSHLHLIDVGHWLDVKGFKATERRQINVNWDLLYDLLSEEDEQKSPTISRGDMVSGKRLQDFSSVFVLKDLYIENANPSEVSLRSTSEDLPASQDGNNSDLRQEEVTNKTQEVINDTSLVRSSRNMSETQEQENDINPVAPPAAPAMSQQEIDAEAEKAYQEHLSSGGKLLDAIQIRKDKKQELQKYLSDLPIVGANANISDDTLYGKKFHSLVVPNKLILQMRERINESLANPRREEVRVYSQISEEIMLTPELARSQRIDKIDQDRRTEKFLKWEGITIDELRWRMRENNKYEPFNEEQCWCDECHPQYALMNSERRDRAFLVQYEKWMAPWKMPAVGGPHTKAVRTMIRHARERADSLRILYSDYIIAQYADLGSNEITHQTMLGGRGFERYEKWVENGQPIPINEGWTLWTARLHGKGPRKRKRKERKDRHERLMEKRQKIIDAHERGEL